MNKKPREGKPRFVSHRHLDEKLNELEKGILGINEDKEDLKNELKNIKKLILDLQGRGRESDDRLRRIENQANTNSNAIKEVIWSQVFHDTIENSNWLRNKAFSPGRWGVGYAFLYVMYRVLNEFKPQSILEMGLGESTKMTAQYAQENEDIEHIITEHDQAWCDFFSYNNTLPKNTEIKKLDLEKHTYKNDTEVLSYSKFYETFEGEKFDFICIDAPFGGKAIEYARIDVCRLLPNILNNSFVIMLDDSQRKGEKNTIIEMESILIENKIPFKSDKYRGVKEFYIATSPDLAFLCSL